MEPGLQNTHLFSTLGIPYIWVSGGSLLWCLLYVWRDVWVLFLSHSINWAVLDSSPKAASSLQATFLLHASYLNNLLLYHPCWLFPELLSPKSRKRVANAVANSSQQHCVVESCRSPISVPFVCSASYLWLHNSSVLETKAPLSHAVLHMQTAHLLECPMWSSHHIWLRSLWKSHHYIEF